MKPQPKIKRIIDEEYTEWIKEQPCIAGHRLFNGTLMNQCNGDVVPMHKNILGGTMGGKTHDIYTLPCCVGHHTQYKFSDHGTASKAFWGKTNIPLLILIHIYEYSMEFQDDTPFNGMNPMLFILSKISENWE